MHIVQPAELSFQNSNSQSRLAWYAHQCPLQLHLFHQLSRSMVSERTTCRCPKPFVWHAESAAIVAADPSDEDRINFLDLLRLLISRRHLRRLRGGDSAPPFRSLFAEKSVDGVHLFLVVSVLSITSNGRPCPPTFSSSLRFSLRFFLRRAISVRRMARSSAVRCFFTCGSVHS